MKIIITAGGTSEKIDDVRTITNSSTGSLGKAIAEAFVAAYEASQRAEHASPQGDVAASSSEESPATEKDDKRKIEKIYYLHGLRAVLPDHPIIEKVPIGGVLDLQDNLTRILKEEEIHIGIHAMAVSDYMVHQVTTLDKLMGTEDPADAQDLSGNKISSDIDDLIIHMKRSPKVISGIKQTSPETVLVGFKLLSGVPHEELIDVGYRLLQKNGCDFVMANDLREIGEGFHKGYLIHRDKSYDRMDTNEEIAAMILKRTTEKVRQTDM